MLMLSHGQEVRRDALAAIPTPVGTHSWRPVPHYEVATTLTERAAARGLRITSERYAVSDGCNFILGISLFQGAPKNPDQRVHYITSDICRLSRPGARFMPSEQEHGETEGCSPDECARAGLPQPP